MLYFDSLKICHMRVYTDIYLAGRLPKIQQWWVVRVVDHMLKQIAAAFSSSHIDLHSFRPFVENLEGS